MYTKYFGLKEKPFSITPDPHFLYLSERHAEALAHLVYGVTESGGFIQLTGEVGTGKTTLTRCLLERLPETVDLAVILNPKLTVQEFLLTIFDELGLPSPNDNASNKEMVDALNGHLLGSHAHGRRTVLLIDEAQNLDSDVLEQLRLLTNLETSKEKLLQIMLVGQPELRDTLARNDLRQLAQRITGRYHLENLTADETVAYVKHRMKVAGNDDPVFDKAALWEIHKITQGSPRLTNIICDRALLGAYSAESHTVTKKIVQAAAVEVLGTKSAQPEGSNSSVGRKFAAAALTLALLAGVAIPLLLKSSHDAPHQASNIPTVNQIDDQFNNQTDSQIAKQIDYQTEFQTERQEVTINNTDSQYANHKLALTHSLNLAPRQQNISALGLLLANKNIDTSTDRAFEAIFKLWQKPVSFGSQAPCLYALSQQLRCEYLVGSMRVISSINRPAILSLIDENGQTHHVVLSHVGNDTLTFQIDQSRYYISKDDLSKYWSGEFLVLWQPQPGADSLMVPGTRSDGIAWLRATLAHINGEQTPGFNSTYFDQELAERVTQFQRDHKLEPDGMVGIQTLIAINTARGNENTPLLTR